MHTRTVHEPAIHNGCQNKLELSIVFFSRGLNRDFNRKGLGWATKNVLQKKMGQVTSNDELRGLNQLPLETQKGTTHWKETVSFAHYERVHTDSFTLMFWQFNTSKPWYNTPVNTHSDKHFILEGLVTFDLCLLMYIYIYTYIYIILISLLHQGDLYVFFHINLSASMLFVIASVASSVWEMMMDGAAGASTWFKLHHGELVKQTWGFLVY